jgi:HPt (histidine-containing phosphotransfer) domain-containing protein
MLPLEERVREHFREAFGITGEAADRLLATCRESLAEGLAALGLAVADADRERVVHFAHSLKGNLLNAGLDDLAEAARRLEERAGREQPLALAGDIERLRAALSPFLGRG